jgi:N-acetylmuramoyl-L-alanine amidase
MLPFAYYLLKITICSAVLFGYYWFLLRNKVFHGYNRFYLLAIVGLSIFLPLCRINIFAEKHAAQTGVIKILQVVTDGDEYMDEVIIGGIQQNSISFVDFLPFIYVLVSLVLFALLVRMLVTIFLLAKKHTHTKIEHIHFINTEAAKGTPFSFFKYIFWNNQIDLQSPEGTRIFKHELAHIQALHSWDKMFINLILILFWSNPIFWHIRRELSMIHEFIADKKAVEDGDTAAFAAMILATTYPQHNITIANNFFYSPIKRRLMMLTKNNNKTVNYISRLLVLPVLVTVFAAFTIKAKEYDNPAIKENKVINVVIDAGHGGTDPGATSINGVTEKDMALVLAKKIKELNKNDNINIILSRETDVFNNVREKAEFANNQKADLFVSIHLSGDTKRLQNKKSGLEIYVSRDSFPNSQESKVLGTSILTSFKNNYELSVIEPLKQRKAGIGYCKLLMLLQL